MDKKLTHAKEKAEDIMVRNESPESFHAAREIVTAIKEFDESPSGSEAWVSVEDRLPKHNQKVDLWLVPEDEEKSHRISWTWEGQDTANTKINGCRITHWLPAPQQPIK